jgi:hypothetical protein
VGSSTIFYRGRFILDAIYDDLFSQHSLGSADTVLVSGCSAGGLAVYVNIEHVEARIKAVNPATRVLGVPGAGFFMGEARPFSGSGYLANYQWVFENQNVSGSLNSGCMAARSATNDQWRCFIANETLPFTKTPLFISNSLTDAWQAGAIMGLGCNPASSSSCSAAQMAYIADFRAQMLTALAPVLAPGSIHGGFLQGCFVHVVEDVGGFNSRPLVQNQTQAQTLAAWIGGAGAPAGLPAVVGTFPPWSNPTC